MKKFFKKNIIMLFLIMLFFTIIFNVGEVNADYSSEMIAALNKTETDKTTGASNSVTSITGTIIASVRIIGVCVAITMLLAIAMKYMSAAPGEKADIKKSAVVYVVGAIILFAVVGILGIIESFSSVIS